MRTASLVLAFVVAAGTWLSTRSATADCAGGPRSVDIAVVPVSMTVDGASTSTGDLPDQLVLSPSGSSIIVSDDAARGTFQ